MNNKGRPAKEKGREVHITVRLTEEEAQKLDYVMFCTGDNKSEILRDGLDLKYKIERNKEFM